MSKHLVITAVAAGALALPAAAGAHPGIFSVAAKQVPAGTTAPTEGQLTTQNQFAILNDGYVIVLRDSNDLTAVTGNGQLGNGMLNYKVLPGAFRNNTAVFASKDDWLSHQPAKSSLQPHATCDTPALRTASAIRAWQSDPFYSYVPFQKAAVGIADEPEKWIPLVKQLTGVDLATATDAKAACEALPGPGVFHAADAVVTTPANASSASVADAVKPLAEQNAALQAAKVAAETVAARLREELAVYQQASTPLKATITGTPSRTTGVTLALAGPAALPLKVTLRVSQLTARRLKLRSTLLAEGTATTGKDGKATVTLRPKALPKGGGRVGITAQAAGSSRIATATGTL